LNKDHPGSDRGKQPLHFKNKKSGKRYFDLARALAVRHTRSVFNTLVANMSKDCRVLLRKCCPEAKKTPKSPITPARQRGFAK
jgi:hypothetical protein